MEPVRVPDPASNLFDDDGGLASFSHGLFGPIDKHFPAVGFFDERSAGFKVSAEMHDGGGEYERAVSARLHRTRYIRTSWLLRIRIYSTTASTLPSNYNGPVVPAGTPGLPWGDWLPYRLGT